MKEGDFMKEKIIAIAKDALNSNDRCGTWFYKLKYATNKLWAICFSWMDYDNTGDFKLYGKVAYQPKNSMMQCDYDIDWIFPINSNGDCDDTEILINLSSIDSDIDYLLDNWKRIEKEYIEYIEA